MVKNKKPAKKKSKSETPNWDKLITAMVHAPNKKKSVKKKAKSTAELTKGFEEFIEGKELNDNNANAFERAIKNSGKLKK